MHDGSPDNWNLLYDNSTAIANNMLIIESTDNGSADNQNVFYGYSIAIAQQFMLATINSEVIRS
jgi:hypothetical protein